VKVDILLNGELVDEFSTMVHRDKAVARGRQMCKALAPHFLGDEERLRQAVESILWTPAFDRLERSKYLFPSYPESVPERLPDTSPQDLVRDVKMFLQHVARKNKALGLS